MRLLQGLLVILAAATASAAVPRQRRPYVLRQEAPSEPGGALPTPSVTPSQPSPSVDVPSSVSVSVVSPIGPSPTPDPVPVIPEPPSVSPGTPSDIVTPTPSPPSQPVNTSDVPIVTEMPCIAECSEVDEVDDGIYIELDILKKECGVPTSQSCVLLCEDLWSEFDKCYKCVWDQPEHNNEELNKFNDLYAFRRENCDPCESVCGSIGAPMNASCTDGKIACHGLCPNYDLASSCWDCANKYHLGYAYPQRALEFYCEESCGKDCGWVGDTYAQQCENLENPSDCVLCNGADARPTLDRCNICVRSSLLYTEQKSTVLASLAIVYEMCKKDDDPVPKGCEKECEIITKVYPGLCNGQDADKCRGICPPPSKPVEVKVPNPIGLPEVVDRENKNPPPRNITSRPNRNPFGNTTVPINAKNDQTSSGGIPTWGIGVAVGGSVILVVGAAAAFIANGYECDHDHRRLRRKKKNKKKRNDDDNMPAPEMQQEPEKPHVVGYMVPAQGYASVPTHDYSTSQYPQQYPQPVSQQYPQQYPQDPYGEPSQYQQGGRY
ncbi:uncharacterized protein CcaverHIS019_0500990 [Cutaneotrichosporon cavernicola]|uniref:Uncharacterized protein n=1 Tax=Cutaneotrichosporon cavernicola TaxID=279322 RepID=A0AA48L5S6_9TREE|nr:uncharacterized protein CcaverHIS019_0500990 [Cutaneotrichosporon cavernicola]BEI92471.1 hypothetical protein CcaverHIS019_0500990 [Cutaneotrichosporon cavernicola]